jgi:hypothetical protein
MQNIQNKKDFPKFLIISLVSLIFIFFFTFLKVSGVGMRGEEGFWTGGTGETGEIGVGEGTGTGGTGTRCSIGENEVYGWAWSKNIGWISFNCCNYHNGDITNLLNNCSSSNYKVSIDPNTGVFAGYAWSSNIGWISFNQQDCPEGPCGARLDLNNNKISGWARAYQTNWQDPNLGGWSGWIRFNDPNPNNEPNYGVSLNRSNNEFEGWAWGGGGNSYESAVLGWISFNCNNQTNCNSSNYKVIWNRNTSQNIPPSASDLSSGDSYCGIGRGIGEVNLSWKYQDYNNPPSNQEQYHLQVATNSDFSSTVINCIVTQTPSGEQGSSRLNVLQAPYNVCNDGGELGNRTLAISYGNTYYWRLKVKNQQGFWSDWHTASNFFQTPSHPYPWVNFSWSPQNPRGGEQVKFCSVVGGNCNDEPNGGWSECFDSDGKCDSWFWQFPNGWNPSSSQDFNPTSTAGEKGDVKLSITDSDSYSCEKAIEISSTRPLPRWREILPF